MTKVSKASVSYRPGNLTRRCGNCSMYSAGSCSLVEGKIEPKMVCDWWEAKDA